MTAATPGRSLFRLLVLPVVGLVLAAVIANVAFAAFLATRRSLDAARGQQERVAAALAESRVALTQPVLDTLRELTGSEFIVWSPSAGTVGLTTLPAEVLARHEPAALAAAAGRNVSLAGRLYHVGTTHAQGVRPETVLVLTPVQGLMRTAGEAAWPVLAVALATIAVLVPLGLVTTTRLARRILALERHVARIALGRFGERLAAGHPADDLGRLAAGVDHLSGALASLRTRLVAGERQRLLGQLAAGFAHELRNAVTGARLAVELHGRRCGQAGAAAGDDSLAVAIRQLDILEEQVRGLLALGRPDAAAPEPVDVARLLDEVRGLTGPRCEHAGVSLEQDATGPAVITGRRERLRTALVNLALNAIDAAGRRGRIRLSAALVDGMLELAVEDDGPGPPADLVDSLTEPFVTGKPEGIGLGLAVARAVAEEHGGRLSWSREGGLTRFSLALPLARSVLPEAVA